MKIRGCVSARGRVVLDETILGHVEEPVRVIGFSGPLHMQFQGGQTR